MLRNHDPFPLHSRTFDGIEHSLTSHAIRKIRLMGSALHNGLEKLGDLDDESVGIPDAMSLRPRTAAVRMYLSILR
jgi:hypothetical protein